MRVSEFVNSPFPVNPPVLRATSFRKGGTGSPSRGRDFSPFPKGREPPACRQAGLR